MPKGQDKVPHQGRQSGKSSNKWFTSNGRRVGHPKGNGASTGDGQNTDTSIVGKIIPKFLRGNR